MKKAGDLLYNYTCKYIAECVVAGLQAGGIGVPAVEAGTPARKASHSYVLRLSLALCRIMG